MLYIGYILPWEILLCLFSSVLERTVFCQGQKLRKRGTRIEKKRIKRRLPSSHWSFPSSFLFVISIDMIPSLSLSLSLSRRRAFLCHRSKNP